MNNWYCIKLKSFCTTKQRVRRLKAQPLKWEKIFNPLIRDYYLKSTVNSENTTPKVNTPMKNWAHELNRKFSKEEVQMANKHMKCSSSLIIKKKKIKTILRFHLTPVRMTIIKGN
jgi:hypothetical protein